MKLKELLMEIFSSGEYPKAKSRFGIMDGTIYGEDLEQFKERILQTEEFSECEELIILKYPTIQLVSEVKLAETLRLGENQKFKGNCYLLSLALTPEMFDPNKIHTPVLDGACITPTMYDPTTFEPKKKIVLEFSPEMTQDQDIYAIGNPSMIESAEKNGESILRKQLHETLDKIFDNPELYRIKGEKGVVIRGLFEEVVTPTSTHKTDLIGINPEKQTHIRAYFFEKDEKTSTDSQINLKLSSIAIPIELSDKYAEELGSKSVNVTREEIEKFLEDNK